MKRTGRFLQQWIDCYTRARIPRASAALSYYITMTLFPLIICLYTLLGSNYAKAMRIVLFAEQFLSAETVRYIRSFLVYVANNNSQAMLLAGATVLITSASAAWRSLQATIGDMQGGQRYEGFMGFVFSILFSLLFLAVMYFAILVMLTGRSFLETVNGLLPFIDISQSWQYLRFIILGGIEYIMFCGVFEGAKRKTDHYSTFPGAILATLGLVAMSWLFSAFIAASARYPLVYGSLASLVLLMFWLFLSCQIIYFGAALNIVIRDFRAENNQEKDQ